MRVSAVFGAIAGVWLVAAPWLNLDLRPAGQMNHMMSTPSPLDASVLTWHLIPGVLTITAALVVVFFSRGSGARRWLGLALIALGLWAAAGPWILPQFGLGGMTMGLSPASFLRHIVPGTVLALCGTAVMFTVASARRPGPGAKSVEALRDG